MGSNWLERVGICWYGLKWVGTWNGLAWIEMSSKGLELVRMIKSRLELFAMG